MARRRGKRREKRWPLLAVAAAASAILILVATTPAEPPPQRRVIILDTLPNTEDQSFTTRCREILEPAGYSVESHVGSNVTVDLIRSLGDTPLLILREHSSVFDGGVWFYTGEPYSNAEHVLAQLANELHIGRTSPDAAPTFAVGSSFIRGSLGGKLNGTLVILMGCDGMDEGDLAEAFLDSGASSYVGWEGPVSVEQTDGATLELLRLLVGGAPLGEALGAAGRAAEGIGFNSTMTIYPLGSGKFILPPP